MEVEVVKVDCQDVKVVVVGEEQLALEVVCRVGREHSK